MKTGRESIMTLELRNIEKKDIAEATIIWNQIIEAADSFPDDTLLDEDEARAMFNRQTETVCAFDDGRMVGVYILHPNNFGRCGHISNASYAVDRSCRGKGVGKAMVLDCIERAKKNNFKGLQFNAVVSDNYPAIALYLKLGFAIIGMVKNGYRLKDDTFRDTIIFLKSW